ncbi:MAG: PEGA domain-containing protein [Pseudomonadota bacterium]
MKKNTAFAACAVLACVFSIALEKMSVAQIIPTTPPTAKTTEIYPIVISTHTGLDLKKEVIYKAALNAIAENPQFSSKKGIEIIHGKKPSSEDLAKKADALFKEAFQLYEDLDIPGAIEKAEEALEKLELGAAYLDDLTLVVNILHLLGTCYTFNGDLNESSAAFLRAYLINPALKPDQNMYPPDICDVFEAVGAGAAQVGMGSISVSSEPKGASVYLDGMPMGVTPVTIDNIVIGKHFIRLSKLGYQYFGSVLTIKKDETRTLSATLQSIPGVSRILTEKDNIPSLFAKGVESTLPSMQIIAKDLGVEQLLVILMTPGEGGVASISIYVYERLSNSIIAQRQGESPSMSDDILLSQSVDLSKSALTAAIMKEVGKPGTVTTIEPPPVVGPGTKPKETKEKKKSIAKKWWFWVVLIAGAGVVAGGAYLGYAGGTGQLGGDGPGGSGGTGDIIIEF